MPPEPAELAADVLQDAPEALDTWFRAEHPLVWRLCFGFLAQEAEADDLAQEALLKLHDRLPNWDQERSYSTWRNTVVANLCRDRLRRRSNRRDAETNAAEAGLPDRLPSPEDRAEANEVREALGQALRNLTPREREVFVLRDLEGQSADQVATSLGITASTVRSLGTLARQRMRQLLAPRLPGLLAEGELL
ncbi:MAG: RNA polymerase sigma-70 factor (ECF subfamily) [Planctomycetota bacterium]|jgi:RNA polymerase sigma-70 factor (ECF subfamily)